MSIIKTGKRYDEYELIVPCKDMRFLGPCETGYCFSKDMLEEIMNSGEYRLVGIRPERGAAKHSSLLVWFNSNEGWSREVLRQYMSEFGIEGGGFYNVCREVVQVLNNNKCMFENAPRV